MEADPKPKPAKRSRLKACSFVEGLPDNQFAKLTKCVSCDTRWTTRKTVNQKKKHIQSCAKKRGLTAETIRIAVLNDIKNAKAAALRDAEKVRAKGESSSTLLEVTVNAAKRARRPPRGTVKSVASTRGAISKRAKGVLACTPQITEDQSALLMGADDDTRLPSTQQFGQSTLANRYAPEGGLFAAASINFDSKCMCQPEKGEYFEASSTESTESCSRETSVSDTG